jgi:hypothetical protein
MASFTRQALTVTTAPISPTTEVAFTDALAEVTRPFSISLNCHRHG